MTQLHSLPVRPMPYYPQRGINMRSKAQDAVIVIGSMQDVVSLDFTGTDNEN